MLCIRHAGMGLLRSYFYCIRHETDLRVAQQDNLHLVPAGVTWQQWCAFSATFDAIDNWEVSPRYRYGKLQLSRLHWLVRIRLRELNYYYIDGGYGESFARYYGPLLFVFGILSVLLSAMQVGMAVEQLQSRNWATFWSLCRWFSVTIRTQSVDARLQPQTNVFNSSYHLTASQQEAAGIDNVLANNVEVALNFERSNWAEGPVSELDFYRVPSNSSQAAAGTILKVEGNVNASAFTLPPDTAISRIIYQTETFNGSLVPASAYVLWPFLPRKTSDGYAVVTWAHATTGAFAECGPSHVRNLWYHFMVPYALVLQGYVVVAADYQGLGVGVDAHGNDVLHPYMTLPSDANDVFYAVQAAQSAFESLSKNFVVIGHSQGGGVAWAAAQRQATRPVDGYLGTVAGSPLTDFIAQVDVLQGNTNYLGALVARGLQDFYPGFNLSRLLTAQGIRRFNLATEIQACNPVFTQLLSTNDNYQPGWQHDPLIETYQNMTGAGGRDFAGPLLVVQGAADLVVPAEIVDVSVNQTCERFPDGDLEYQSYAGVTHIPAMYAAQRNWLKWIEDRFEGKDVEKGCVRRRFESALPVERYQPELNWFIEYALDGYEVQ
ncbi:MAG: hypothetical protein Q9219_004655 [cf. Caloplaca sp. 3 TL-2023]